MQTHGVASWKGGKDGYVVRNGANACASAADDRSGTPGRERSGQRSVDDFDTVLLECGILFVVCICSSFSLHDTQRKLARQKNEIECAGRRVHLLHELKSAGMGWIVISSD